jgi:hypothetical protein
MYSECWRSIRWNELIEDWRRLRALMPSPALPRKVMKLSAIVEKLNRARESSLSSQTVCSHLNGLVRSGRFEKAKRGHYRRR